MNTSGFGRGSVYTAATLGLSDFYKVHVLDVCQGQFEPTATAINPQENVTSCSSTQAGFYFDLSTVVAQGLPPGATLGNVTWPNGITAAASSNRATSIAMFFFFVVGIATAAFSVVTGLWGIWSKRTLSSVMAFATNFVSNLPWIQHQHHIDMSLQIGFLNSGLAAACATALSVNSTNNINTYGNSLGISAKVGVGFLGLAWAATASMLGAAVFAGAQGFAGRHYSGYYKASMRHMRVPRWWRHPGMRYHAVHPMGMPQPAMHPAMHPAVYPAMHTDMHAGMGYPPMMHPSMGHPSMMHPAGMHPYMGYPSMGHPYMGHPYYG